MSKEIYPRWWGDVSKHLVNDQIQVLKNKKNKRNDHSIQNDYDKPVEASIITNNYVDYEEDNKQFYSNNNMNYNNNYVIYQEENNNYDSNNNYNNNGNTNLQINTLTDTSRVYESDRPTFSYQENELRNITTKNLSKNNQQTLDMNTKSKNMQKVGKCSKLSKRRV